MKRWMARYFAWLTLAGYLAGIALYPVSVLASGIVCLLVLGVAIWGVRPSGQRWLCRHAGCAPDWPDMDRCWRCGSAMNVRGLGKVLASVDTVQILERMAQRPDLPATTGDTVRFKRAVSDPDDRPEVNP